MESGLPKELVSNMADIKENMFTIQKCVKKDEKKGDGKNKEEKEEFKTLQDLIKNGKNFVAMMIDGEFYFAPSKFVGHKNNGIMYHDKNKNKFGHSGGGTTNKKIDKILGEKDNNISLEKEYRSFLKKLKIEFDAKQESKCFWWGSDVEAFLKSSLTQAQKEQGLDINSFLSTVEKDQALTQTEREQLIKVRVGQGRYRKELLELWKGQCSVTGLSIDRLLIASHIKPWKDSNDDERLNEYNGLLLSPNLDSLFDKGFITFDEKGEITISDKLSDINLKLLNVTDDMYIKNYHDEHEQYMQWHRKNVYQK